MSGPTPSSFFSGEMPGKSRDFHSALRERVRHNQPRRSHESTFMFKCKGLTAPLLFLWWEMLKNMKAQMN